MTAWTQAGCCVMLASTLVACQTTPRIPEPSLTNQTWRLKQVDQYHVEYDRYNLLPQLWLVANDNVFSGRDGCTWLGGEYQLHHKRLSFRLNTDDKNCQYPHRQSFIQHLQHSKSYYIKDQQLFIVGKDKKVHLVFDAREGQPQVPLRTLAPEPAANPQLEGVFFLTR